MKPTILICCASSIATSTVVAYKVREALEENGLEANVIQSSFAEMNAKVEMTNPDLIMVTGTVTVPEGIPRIVATPLLTGIGADKVIKEMVEVIRNVTKG